MTEIRNKIVGHLGLEFETYLGFEISDLGLLTLYSICSEFEPKGGIE